AAEPALVAERGARVVDPAVDAPAEVFDEVAEDPPVDVAEAAGRIDADACHRSRESSRTPRGTQRRSRPRRGCRSALRGASAAAAPRRAAGAPPGDPRGAAEPRHDAARPA